MRAIVTYIKKQTFQIDAENAYDAANQAEKKCPDGFEVADWKWESEDFRIKQISSVIISAKKNYSPEV